MEMESNDITSEISKEVEKALEKMKNNTATGPDNIPIKAIEKFGR